MGFADLLARADAAALDALGDSATYTPAVGDPVEVDGWFDALYEFVDPHEPGVSLQAPAIGLRLSDLPENPAESSGERQNARVTVDGTTYRIREAKPDGKGLIVLILQEA